MLGDLALESNGSGGLAGCNFGAYASIEAMSSSQLREQRVGARGEGDHAKVGEVRGLAVKCATACRSRDHGEPSRAPGCLLLVPVAARRDLRAVLVE
eukprot:2698893-Prymnesium_polylepis.1